jgi:hypothetical protein
MLGINKYIEACEVLENNYPAVTLPTLIEFSPCDKDGDVYTNDSRLPYTIPNKVSITIQSEPEGASITDLSWDQQEQRH